MNIRGFGIGRGGEGASLTRGIARWTGGLAVALGALAGSEVGKSLDRADKMYMARTTQNTLESIPSGQTQQWNNPDSGASGTITPQRTWTNNDGRNCREFQQTVTIGGRTETAYGTACRDNAGGWQIVQ